MTESVLAGCVPRDHFGITCVRGSSLDEVLSRLGVADQAPYPLCTPEEALQCFGWDEQTPAVRVCRSGEWIFLLDVDAHGRSLEPSVLSGLSMGTEAVSVWYQMAGTTRIVHARDGKIMADFDERRSRSVRPHEGARARRKPPIRRSPVRSRGVQMLALLPGRTEALVQKAGTAEDQNRIGITGSLDGALPYVLQAPLGISPDPVQQPADPARTRPADLLGQGPLACFRTSRPSTAAAAGRYRPGRTPCDSGPQRTSRARQFRGCHISSAHGSPPVTRASTTHGARLRR